MISKMTRLVSDTRLLAMFVLSFVTVLLVMAGWLARGTLWGDSRSAGPRRSCTKSFPLVSELSRPRQPKLVALPVTRAAVAKGPKIPKQQLAPDCRSGFSIPTVANGCQYGFIGRDIEAVRLPRHHGVRIRASRSRGGPRLCGFRSSRPPLLSIVITPDGPLPLAQRSLILKLALTQATHTTNLHSAESPALGSRSVPDGRSAQQHRRDRRPFEA